MEASRNSPNTIKGVVVMDPVMVVVMFWPVLLTFSGGCIMRNASSKKVGVGVLVGLSILATWAMGMGDLDRLPVWVSLVCGGLLGLAADLGPIFRDIRDLFGCEDPLDESPPP
ncbi:MAG: hypothetical protein Q8P56_02420 [Candidatus Uhrbacteria bacterium]|nr:hypothetical protein [Candidatus Uhrbacteria bacterium]